MAEKRLDEIRAQQSVGMEISIKRFVEMSWLLLVKLKIENRRGEVSDEKHKKYTYDINKLLK